MSPANICEYAQGGINQGDTKTVRDVAGAVGGRGGMEGSEGRCNTVNLEEVINQLINLRGHCENFIEPSNEFCIWKKNVKALEIAINFVKGNRILDACCGSRMFWFDKNNEDTCYMDNRKEEFEIHGKYVNVNPDIVADFRNIPFPDSTFYLVVFDPPHLKWAGPNGIMKAQYGQLNKNTWKDDLAKGFEECMRVLKSNGTLVFKWSDSQINVKEVLKLIPFKPLFGNQRGNTHWMVFMKDQAK